MRLAKASMDQEIGKEGFTTARLIADSGSYGAGGVEIIRPEW